MKAPITFREKGHTYTHNVTGERFTSVTTLLGKYKKPFDSEATALKCSTGRNPKYNKYSISKYSKILW